MYNSLIWRIFTQQLLHVHSQVQSQSLQNTDDWRMVTKVHNWDLQFSSMSLVLYALEKDYSFLPGDYKILFYIYCYLWGRKLKHKKGQNTCTSSKEAGLSHLLSSLFPFLSTASSFDISLALIIALSGHVAVQTNFTEQLWLWNEIEEYIHSELKICMKKTTTDD